MTNWLLRSVVAITAVLAGACTSASSGPNANVHPVTDSGATYVPAADWRTASPEAVGLDASRIETLTRNVGAGRYGSVQGVLIVRYGHLVYEQYAGWSREQAHTMQSVTKSVTSLLFGILANTAPRERVDLDRPVVDVGARIGPPESQVATPAWRVRTRCRAAHVLFPSAFDVLITVLSADTSNVKGNVTAAA